MFRRRHDRQALLLSLGTSVPGLVVALALIWTSGLSFKVAITGTTLLCVAWFLCTLALQDHIVRPLQRLSNLLGALREGDFSLRARSGTSDDSLGLAFSEVNQLAEALRKQRFSEIEALALLDRVLAEIHSAIFVFDTRGRLALINRAGTDLIGRHREQALGRTAAELGIASIEAEGDQVIDAPLPGGSGRWDVRSSTIRGDGKPQRLIVVTSLEHALRAEERQAWKRLVRVLTHEINNSLAPIQSIAATLRTALSRPLPDDWRGDFDQGLEVVHRRSKGLARFMTAYTELARLPQPDPIEFDVAPWLEHAATCETRLAVEIARGPELRIHADQEQLDQALINLLRNAVDAALEADGGVRLGWNNGSDSLEVWIEDEGPGLADTANLFVPFFTTKNGGNGIGLALSRQIVEAHGGKLTLCNRADRTGCRATMRIPIRSERFVS